MPLNNNDTFTIDQSNGASDNDQNLNGFSLGQTGAMQIVWDDQSISSGGNSQINSSDVVDSGLFNLGIGSQNDEYTVDQSNNLFDSDKNTNVFVGTQAGLVNIGGVDQSIHSGDNAQNNNSDIWDSGYTGIFSSGSNDTYDVTQFNGMRDEDVNSNSVTLAQGASFGDFAFVSQNTTSGDSYQGNNSNIDDTGTTFLFGGMDNSDEFTLDQSNEMLDSDLNVSSATVGQLGGLNFGFSDQSIDSGGNSQENNSDVSDAGLSSLFAFDTNNDVFDIGQSNEMADNDQNGNVFTLGQAGFLNFGDGNQSIDSGGNSQENNSGVFDFGSSFAFGSGSNNDEYTIDQGNTMLDNDINVNVGTVGQAGFGNVASIDQDITSGGNSQVNNSSIFDTGFDFGGGSNNDTYDLTQSNVLLDNDTNTNTGSVTQIFGPGNFGDLSQGIDSGNNDSGNHSNVFDFGV